MARLRNNIVVLTRSGIFARLDKGIGLLVFSPYSGLVFLCDEDDAIQVHDWLNQRDSHAPSNDYRRALGPGWLIPYHEAGYPYEHLLSSEEKAWHIPGITKPVVINWLITGQCPLRCCYCYAEDLMRDPAKEPDTDRVQKTASTILSYMPLVVVLTGGDPLCSPHLELALSLLHGKVGIVLDTSAYPFKSDHIALFKKYDVYVRISLDSEIPRINRQLRPVCSRTSRVTGSVEKAVEAIDKCLSAGIRVGVQTVATRKNRHDLSELGDKLLRLGISGWRILMVAPSPGKELLYHELSGSHKSQHRFYEYTLAKIQKTYQKHSASQLAVEVAHNQVPNAVILVGPDGTFYTEQRGKIEIDSKYPRKPRASMIFRQVSSHGHASRYLSLNPFQYPL
jgi:MoaA/NifB/PqqE/SkfB family radical SAM enzyme